MLLDPKIQLVMLKDYGYGPVLKSVVIPPELGKMAPIGERAAKLYNPTGRSSTRSARNGPSGGIARSSAELIATAEQYPWPTSSSIASASSSGADRRRRPQPRGRPGGVRFLSRSLWLRQDHDLADDRGFS